MRWHRWAKSTQFDGKTGKLFSEMSMIQYTRFHRKSGLLYKIPWGPPSGNPQQNLWSHNTEFCAGSAQHKGIGKIPLPCLRQCIQWIAKRQKSPIKFFVHILWDPPITMMLGSKGILPPTDAYELLRCKAAHAILQTFEIRWFTA